MHHPMPLLSDAKAARPTRGSGLGESELLRANNAILPIVPDWCVELCGSDSADCALVVMPEDAGDEIGPTYIIRYEAGQ